MTGDSVYIERGDAVPKGILPRASKRVLVVPKDVQTPAKMKKVAAFCDRMGVEARQGEVGLVIADEYFAFRNFKETKR